MTSEQIADAVADWLNKDGYDGLYAEECSCTISELMKCGYCENLENCQPFKEADVEGAMTAEEDRQRALAVQTGRY